MTDNPLTPAATTPNGLPFEIILGEDKNPITNGDVAIRWCVTPECAVDMEEQGIEDPHILFVTVDRGYEMQRQLIPLGEIMSFARFTRAGEMSVFAWIINGKPGRKKIRKTFLSKTCGLYNTTVQVGGDPITHIPGRSFKHTSVDVTIPAGVFGREPRPAIKWFVNKWHSGRVVDQCNFRQRMLLAFTLKWIPLLLWVVSLILVRVIFTGGMILGGYKKFVHFGRSFLPYKWYGFSSIKTWDNHSRERDKPTFKNCSYLIKRTLKNGDDHHFVLALPFCPLVLIIVGSLVSIFGIDGHGPALQEWAIEMLNVLVVLEFIAIFIDLAGLCVLWAEKTPLWNKIRDVVVNTFSYIYDHKTVHIPLVGVIGLLLLYGFVLLCIAYWEIASIMLLLGVVGGVFMVISTYAVEWMFLSAKYNNPTKIEALMCPCDDPRAKLIPRKQKTIRLRFLDWKSRVCKPMQM